MNLKFLFSIALFNFLLIVPGADWLQAQPTSATDSGPILTAADLDQLVGPIALYPDPLIALILPASTVPTDIVLANRYLENGGDPNAVDAQSWDDSVKGLAHYPDVLKMMDENLDWTNQLGAAVLSQQADVMMAIQTQRAKAQALGNLESTAQQQVLTDQQVIQIVPANPQVIYVPVYDPQVVYVERAPAVPFISFGIGLAIGAWLGGDCDWHRHGIYRGGYYRPGYGWGNTVNVNINTNNNYVWQPNPNKPKPKPPYRPGRPGNPGGGNGQLPGWTRPPGGNRPSPGKPGGPGAAKPQPKPNPPGNGAGNGPGNRPARPGNRPGPDKPNHDKPSTRPAPGQSQLKPAPTHPAKPVTRPTPHFNSSEPNSKRPAHKQPSAPSTQPRPTTPTTRPAPQKPSAPAQRPAQHQQAPAKRPAPAAAPQAQRPAPQRGNQNR